MQNTQILRNSLLFLLSLFFLCSFTKPDNPNQISVNVETLTEKKVAYYFTQILPQKDRSKFNGIPKTLTNDNSIIRYYDLRNSIDSVFILIGDLDSLNRICIIDANQNHSFSDDYIYQFNKHNIKEESCFPAQPISFKVKKDKKEFVVNKFYQPHFYDYGNMSFNEEENFFLHHKYYVLMALSERQEGYTLLGNKKYKIVVNDNHYAIVDSNLYDYEKVRKSSLLKSLSQEYIIDNFRIKNCKLSNKNSLFTFEIDDLNTLNKEQKRGVLEHFYALPFEKDDINGKKIKLQDYEGNYVLIDFWGTWCNSCIALLPHIKEIQKKYPRLNIISIAVEFDEKGLSRVPDFIQKYNMNWTNITYINVGTRTHINYLYDIVSYPTTILIAPDGKIIHRGSTGKIPELDAKLKHIFNAK